MLVKEVLRLTNGDVTLDEDWKKTAAKIGLAGAVTLAGVGGGAISDKVTQWMGGKRGGGQIVSGKVTYDKKEEEEAPKIEPLFDSQLEKKLIDYAKAAGLAGEELAQFLAQCAHETMSFRRMIEHGSANYFRRYEKRFAPGRAKLLGNVQPGDGTKFKGRGFIQLTGRYNYARAAKALGIPLLQQPDLASNPEIAAKIAIWYWNTRVKPKVSDFTDTESVTKTINSNLLGLENRGNLFKRYMKTADEENNQ